MSTLTDKASQDDADLRTIMADVHDYFGDERADRSGGRARVIVTLLGNLRCERDNLRKRVKELEYLLVNAETKAERAVEAARVVAGTSYLARVRRWNTVFVSIDWIIITMLLCLLGVVVAKFF